MVWYRRRFDAPDAECLLLHFGAVDYRATVWVNDVEVTRHQGGHVPFSADITQAVRAGDNVVVVRAEDTLGDRTIPRGKQHWEAERSEGIFYTPTTGIWQTVWLEPLPAKHIRGLRLMPDLGSGSVDVAVSGDGPVNVSIRLHGELVGKSAGHVAGAVRLDQVERWSPASPSLYDVEVQLGSDRVEGYFGLRTVEARDGRFWLNGETFTQRLVLDQGYFAGGLMTAPTDDALRRDIEIAMSFGFNGARKHQKVEDPRWLYWADRLGFLVWSEMPSFQAHSAEAERRLAAEWTEAVRRDRDHPSIVVWAPANESFGLEHVDPAVRSRLLVRLYRLTNELDRTRPVVSNDGWEQAITDLCTLHDYTAPAEMSARYRGVETALDGSASGHSAYDPGFAYRGEPILITEFGGARISGSSGWGYREEGGHEQFVESYRGLIEALMQPGPVEGFCYTQLTDVEQEQNGLCTMDRLPKVEPAKIRPLTQLPKRR